MVVEVAVEHEGIRGGQGATGADEAVGRLLLFEKGFPEGVLIAQAEGSVHLLAIETGREAAQIREGPAAGEVRAIAFIELEAGDASVDEVFAMVGAEEVASGLPGEVGNEASPDSEVACVAK